jgi:hypothetical protein
MNKELKRQKNWSTGAMEWDMYLDGRYVGTRASRQGAEAELDRLAMAELTHPHAEGRQELMSKLYSLDRRAA